MWKCHVHVHGCLPSYDIIRVHVPMKLTQTAYGINDTLQTLMYVATCYKIIHN